MLGRRVLPRGQHLQRHRVPGRSLIMMAPPFQQPAPPSFESTYFESRNTDAPIGVTEEDLVECGRLMQGEAPAGDGWELMSDKRNSVQSKVWRKQFPGSIASVYRAHATFSEPLELVLAALTDLSRRTEWDGTCLDLRQLKSFGETKVIYWRVKFPFPLANRDYIYYTRVADGHDYGGEGARRTRLVVSKGVPQHEQHQVRPRSRQRLAPCM